MYLESLSTALLRCFMSLRDFREPFLEATVETIRRVHNQWEYLRKNILKRWRVTDIQKCELNILIPRNLWLVCPAKTQPVFFLLYAAENAVWLVTEVTYSVLPAAVPSSWKPWGYEWWLGGLPIWTVPLDLMQPSDAGTPAHCSE